METPPEDVMKTPPEDVMETQTEDVMETQTELRSCSPPPDKSTSLLCQPDTRPITQEQLVNEVKGIYAGLVMVEMKCVEVRLFTVLY